MLVSTFSLSNVNGAALKRPLFTGVPKADLVAFAGFLFGGTDKQRKTYAKAAQAGWYSPD